MGRPSPHRKQVKHYHQPGDIHELTFSCYRRMPLLTNNTWRSKLSECIDDACTELACHLAAFVYMPEHIHLLVWGLRTKQDVSDLLAAVKQPLSSRVRADVVTSGSRLLKKLTVQERPGKIVFRFWQERPGYDRNLFTPQTVQAAIVYIHLNPVLCREDPVRRSLRVRATDWRWSSACYYASNGQVIDELLPKITPLPAEFWRGP